MMIARVWHGVTREGSADTYLRHLEVFRVTAYRNIPGNLGAFVLRRVSTGVAEFLVISIWESFEAIRRFTGSQEVDAAIYCQQDHTYLAFREPKVVHFEVAAGEAMFLEALRTERRNCGDPISPEPAD